MRIRRPISSDHSISIFILLVEMKILQECMVEIYKLNGSLKDPSMVKISQLREKKLFELENLMAK